MTYKTSDVTQILKGLSSQDFLSFGLQNIAYIKEVEIDNEKVFAVHAADGTPLSVIASHEEARSVIDRQDLKFITLQ